MQGLIILSAITELMKVGDRVRINRPNAIAAHGLLGLIVGLCAPGAHPLNDLWRIQLCDSAAVSAQLLFVAQDLMVVSESR